MAEQNRSILLSRTPAAAPHDDASVQPAGCIATTHALRIGDYNDAEVSGEPGCRAPQFGAGARCLPETRSPGRLDVQPTRRHGPCPVGGPAIHERVRAACMDTAPGRPGRAVVTIGRRAITAGSPPVPLPWPLRLWRRCPRVASSGCLPIALPGGKCAPTTAGSRLKQVVGR